MQRMLPFVLATWLLLPADAAWSVDGVLEINQACAVNTGCFSGDSAGFPVTISTAGSYRLTGNLQVGSATIGINATVDGVHLDLNGFEIRGALSCSATIDGSNMLSGVNCTGSAGTGVEGVAVVRNGRIRGCNIGVRGAGDRGLLVDRLKVSESGNTGVLFTAGGALIFTNSIVSITNGNGLFSPSADGTQIVRNSVFERNASSGLYLANGVASHNTFSQNGSEGIRSQVGLGALIENNYFERNVIGIDANANVGYRSNVFFGNTTDVSPEPENLGANLCDGVPCP